MKRLAHRLGLFFIACSLLVLGACATMDNFRSVVPGQSTGAGVMAKYGTPKRIWDDADGGKTLEYSYQPFGQVCYMIKLDKNDKVLSIEDTLQQAGRSRVTAGMTTEQVNRLLGKERSRMFFPLSGEDVWDWTVDSRGTGYVVRYNVHFRDGKVARTSESLVDPRDAFIGRF